MELWLIIAYAVGTVTGFLLFRTVYKDWIVDSTIRVLEQEGVLRLVKKNGEMHIEPVNSYEDFLEQLAEDLEREIDDNRRSDTTTEE